MNSPLKSATLDLVTLNQASVDQLQEWLANVYPGASWIAEAVIAHRPFASFAAFKYALTQVVQQSSEAAQLKLIQDSAPDWRAVLDLSLNPSLSVLLNDYQTKFGFPFVLAPEGPRGAVVVSVVGGGVDAESFGLSPDEVLSTLQRRLGQPSEFERQESLREVHRIAELRLNAVS